GGIPFGHWTAQAQACSASGQVLAEGHAPVDIGRGRNSVTIQMVPVGPTPSPSPSPIPTSYSFSRTWGSEGSADGQFNFPHGIAIDPATGRVYVSDTGNHRFQRFTPDGTWQGTFTGGSLGTRGVSVTRTGTLMA